ncbi:magnesium chelatase [Sulfolobus sp. A20]|nr:magnesium chelatase [Sulfolobus sp. A20]TRM75590.1 MoxR family ATPase [Sulfolobus sp. A20-N-F8]TRM78031.1 MoxR family ATPase [Sulfolobus sp. B5]TRM80883.1 MoxR family ATPase [Sulfolobus sp. D5]TRM83079.1 MoxR family ATPase [Sulfolobus sp. A20-N-F6]TRM84736.1 MoxR family ATPase [Sulfolobus sp. F3]TRM88026.1 MoxR family ATPase [Sulfolobus sp. C3]TRN01130.1 MoxR family ATPase [Sulfolobus sp. F1]TRN04639.1 MoxR family ATPase [Sulfolobus sp. E1]
MTKKVNEVIDEIMKYFVGEREVIVKIIASILANGHVLMEDVPGIGKTFLSKVLAKVLGLKYSRIQFTPDLLPSDIIGTKVWRQDKGTFETVLGPIFANFILADEINRAPPKVQSALLEAMQEGQVTIEGETIKLPNPFIVVATQNPIELEGTYPLPEAQLDRFLIRIKLGYPKDEVELLKRRISWRSNDPLSQIKVMMSESDLIKIRNLIEYGVKVSDEVMKYIVSFKTIRDDPRILAGPSPRALISLMSVSRSVAFIEGRDYVIPDDVKRVAIEVLSHRIVLKPEISLEGVKGEEIIFEYLNKLPVPK